MVRLLAYHLIYFLALHRSHCVYGICGKSDAKTIRTREENRSSKGGMGIDFRSSFCNPRQNFW